MQPSLYIAYVVHTQTNSIFCVTYRKLLCFLTYKLTTWYLTPYVTTKLCSATPRYAFPLNIYFSRRPLHSIYGSDHAINICLEGEIIVIHFVLRIQRYIVLNMHLLKIC